MNDERPSSRREAGTLSRRNVLKAGGLSALFASTALAVPAFAASSDEQPLVYDAIVIGAGFAGVTAARELRAKGLRTLILEARGRIGGRVWTDTFVGQRIERGAQWISPDQLLVNAERERYGLGTLTGQAPNRVIMPTPDGPKQFTPAEVYTKQGELLEKLFEGSEEYFPKPYEPLYARDRVAAIDGLSLRDRLNQLNLSPQDESWISGTTAGESGGSSSTGALTALAQLWALGGHSWAGWSAGMSYRIETGMSGLLTAMLADSGASLRLNSPVASIYDDGRQVTVTTKAGARFSARTAVVAVPVNVWKNITFQPGLPAVHAAATSEGVGVPNSRKLWLHVSGVTDRVNWHGPEGAQLTTLLSQGQVPGGQLMVSFSYLSSLDVTDRLQVENAVRKILPEASVIEVRAQDWGRDRYSLGGWAMRRPGQLTSHYPAIQQPHGRLAFATADIASGWNGLVDGAIESGLRAAEQAAGVARAVRTPAAA